MDFAYASPMRAVLLRANERRVFVCLSTFINTADFRGQAEPIICLWERTMYDIAQLGLSSQTADVKT